MAQLFTRFLLQSKEVMGKLSKDDVLKLAQLSRLALEESEIEEFTAEISEILKYVEQLQTVDVSGVRPTSQVTGLVNVTRDDEVLDYGYAPSELLENLPDRQDDLIKVKRMID